MNSNCAYVASSSRRLATAWTSRIVLKRKDNTLHNMCVDYRCLNNISRIDIYPMSHISDLMH